MGFNEFEIRSRNRRPNELLRDAEHERLVAAAGIQSFSIMRVLCSAVCWSGDHLGRFGSGLRCDDALPETMSTPAGAEGLS